MQDTNLDGRRTQHVGVLSDVWAAHDRRVAGDNDVPASTPTGIAITHCEACGISHAVSRSHCAVCGSASLFIRAGRCLAHAPEVLA